MPHTGSFTFAIRIPSDRARPFFTPLHPKLGDRRRPPRRRLHASSVSVSWVWASVTRNYRPAVSRKGGRRERTDSAIPRRPIDGAVQSRTLRIGQQFLRGLPLVPMRVIEVSTPYARCHECRRSFPRGFGGSRGEAGNLRAHR